MSRLARVTAAQIIRILEKRGFSLSRQSGGHKTYKHKLSGSASPFRITPGKFSIPKFSKTFLPMPA